MKEVNTKFDDKYYIMTLTNYENNECTEGEF